MNRNQTVSKNFANVPKAELPRAAFALRKRLKTTIGPDNLTPCFCHEVYPADRWSFTTQMFGRLLTPIFPILDSLWLEAHFFYVPNRILWNHWQNFITGRNPDPTDNTVYTVPYMTCPSDEADDYCLPGTIWDHLGLPVYGQPGVGTTLNTRVSALPFRAFATIYNEWYRDPNWVQPKYNYKGPGLYGDGPDKLDGGTTDGSNTWLYPPYRYKKKDYFTSSLPWPQAQTSPVSIANTTTAVPVTRTGVSGPEFSQGPDTLSLRAVMGDATAYWSGTPTANGNPMLWSNPNLEITAANFNAAIGNINQLRTAFQFQKLLERDARSGPRYTEQLQGRWGVHPEDSRLQRPEYLGSVKRDLTFAQVPVTSSASPDADPAPAPTGTLAAYATAEANTHIHFSAPEHGWIMGIVNLTGNISYQQGVPKQYSRLNRLEFYTPEFQQLGEQAILRKEIFCPLDNTTNDAITFGYIPRWDELRFWPDEITGLMRSGIPNTLDAWHLAQSFNGAPTNGATFMQQATPLQRILAVTDESETYNIAALKLDMFFNGTVTRALPMYSVPGFVDHF